LIRKTIKFMGEGVFSILVFVIVLRIAAPFVVEWGINRQLENTEGIYGKVSDVDLHLYRGGYEIEGIQLFMVDGDEQYPLLEIKELDLSIFWGALLDGHIVAEAILIQPAFNLVDRENTEVVTNDAVRDEKTWVDLIKTLTPFSIDRLEVVNGEFHFHKPDGEPKVDVFLTQVNLLVQNITNSRELSNTLLADINVYALVMGESEIKLEGTFDPFNGIPTFDLNMEMQSLPLRHLDDFIKVYTPLDIEGGLLDLALELAAEDGNIKGYLKPGIYELDVFDWREDVRKDNDNPFQLLFEALSGGLAELLENQNRDLLATKIQLQGKIDSPEAPILPVILGILQNGFINAYEIKVEGSVSLDDETGDQDDSEKENH